MSVRRPGTHSDTPVDRRIIPHANQPVIAVLGRRRLPLRPVRLVAGGIIRIARPPHAHLRHRPVSADAKLDIAVKGSVIIGESVDRNGVAQFGTNHAGMLRDRGFHTHPSTVRIRLRVFQEPADHILTYILSRSIAQLLDFERPHPCAESSTSRRLISRVAARLGRCSHVHALPGSSERRLAISGRPESHCAQPCDELLRRLVGTRHDRLGQIAHAEPVEIPSGRPQLQSGRPGIAVIHPGCDGIHDRLPGVDHLGRDGGAQCGHELLADREIHRLAAHLRRAAVTHQILASRDCEHVHLLAVICHTRLHFTLAGRLPRVHDRLRPGYPGHRRAPVREHRRTVQRRGVSDPGDRLPLRIGHRHRDAPGPRAFGVCTRHRRIRRGVGSRLLPHLLYLAPQRRIVAHDGHAPGFPRVRLQVQQIMGQHRDRRMLHGRPVAIMVHQPAEPARGVVVAQLDALPQLVFDAFVSLDAVIVVRRILRHDADDLLAAMLIAQKRAGIRPAQRHRRGRHGGKHQRGHQCESHDGRDPQRGLTSPEYNHVHDIPFLKSRRVHDGRLMTPCHAGRRRPPDFRQCGRRLSPFGVLWITPHDSYPHLAVLGI